MWEVGAGTHCPNLTDGENEAQYHLGFLFLLFYFVLFDTSLEVYLPCFFLWGPNFDSIKLYAPCLLLSKQLNRFSFVLSDSPRVGPFSSPILQLEKLSPGRDISLSCHVCITQQVGEAAFQERSIRLAAP